MDQFGRHDSGLGKEAVLGAEGWEGTLRSPGRTAAGLRKQTGPTFKGDRGGAHPGLYLPGGVVVEENGLP